ncbi:Alpha/Beta hydrolase fold [Sesbania bispinosa]|nr:Alpha/Beta hydrolase fold [Sesbania bispinosa]
MASTTKTVIDELVVPHLGTFLRFYNDGTLDRPLQSPFEPPMLDDPNNTCQLSSKDVIISHNPTISARLYLPNLTTNSVADNKLPIFVYFHGGGFLIESAFSKLYHGFFKTFVPQANVIVVSVEYRLAPENPLPACYHDSWAALQWVASHSTKIPCPSNAETEPWLINHGDFNRVFIGGDSAGGNIAHNIAMRAGTEALPGDVKILGAVLTHPAFYSSYPVGSEPIVEPENNIHFKIWNLAYPSAPGGIDNPVLNPVAPDAPSLAGLGCGKMIVFNAGKDWLVRERVVWYYEAVKKSGWKGKLEYFEQEDEGHVYHLFNPQSENTKRYINLLVSFLHE